MLPEDRTPELRGHDAAANDGAGETPRLVLLEAAPAANDTSDEVDAQLARDPEFVTVCEARRARWIESVEAEPEEAERRAEG